jgi:hypothetical protein
MDRMGRATVARSATAKYSVQSARNALSGFPQIRKPLAEFKRDLKWYDRKELYDIKRKGKQEQRTLSRRVVSEQVGLLLASFQNSRPGTPKVFGRMVVEEVYANKPNACVLESACRHVRRNQDFPPSIAEMLKAIDKEGSAWCPRWEWLDDVDGIDTADYRRSLLESAIAKAESMLAQAQANFAEREAKAKAAEEERRAYREAYERIPIQERRAYEDGQRHAYRRPIPPMPVEYADDDRLRAAYAAGLGHKPIPGLDASIVAVIPRNYAALPHVGHVEVKTNGSG